jgi:hypothetical protein
MRRKSQVGGIHAAGVADERAAQAGEGLFKQALFIRQLHRAILNFPSAADWQIDVDQEFEAADASMNADVDM